MKVGEQNISTDDRLEVDGVPVCAGVLCAQGLFGSEMGTEEDVVQEVLEWLSDAVVHLESFESLDDNDLQTVTSQTATGHFFEMIVLTCRDGKVSKNMLSLSSIFLRWRLSWGWLFIEQFWVFGLADRAHIKLNAAALRRHLMITIGFGDDSADNGHED